MASQQVEMDLSVIGYDNWLQLVPQTISTPDGQEISFDRYVQGICERDSSITRENVIVSYFYRRRYILMEAVLQIEGYPEFGVVTWVRDHISYSTNPDPFMDKDFLSLWDARFIRDNGREVRCCMLSRVSAGFFHRSFIFHKVVFLPPDSRRS